MSASKAPPRVFYGWVVVGASLLSNIMVLGAGTASFTVFLAPMTSALGWSRITYTGAVTAQSLLNIAARPIIGIVLDRLGPRPLMAAGALVAGACYLLLSQVSQPWQFYLLYSFAAAFGLGETGNLVTSATISKWFIRMRGRALAIASTGMNLGQIIFTPLCALLIAAIGWRMTWSVTGLMVVGVVLPIAFVMRRSPEDIGLTPDGAPSEEPAPGGTATSRNAAEPSWGLRQAIRTRAVWILMLSSNLSSLAYSGILYHLVAYYTDSGLSLQAAGVLIGLNHTFALISKIPWGMVAERFPVRYCMMVSYSGRVAGLLILLLSNSPLRFLGYVVVSGLISHGVGNLQSQIWADYYGRANVGTIRGVLAPISILSSIAGPLFSAATFDRTGSYHGAFWVYAGTLTLAVCLLYFATPPRTQPLATPEAQSATTNQPA